MGKQKVLLIGATGETGGSILEGLLERPSRFEVEALVRPASAEKPGTKKLAERGVTLRIADPNDPVEDLVPILNGIDVVVSAIDGFSLHAEKNLAVAAKEAGVKRFVPCNYGTVTPPGVMALRDLKEEVIQHVRRLFLGYTIIDVGWWYQFAFPRLPSGKIDYALAFNNDTMHGEGNAPNLHTDLRDIGRFVARIIDDERTLNKYVFTWGDVLTENEIWNIAEELSGEKLERKYQPFSDTLAVIEILRKAAEEDPQNPVRSLSLYAKEYELTKFIRQDNTPEYAKYLGYLDARELYPDFAPTTFRNYFSSVIEGKESRPHAGGQTTGLVSELAKSGKENKEALLEILSKIKTGK